MDEADREARRVPKYLDQTDQIFGRDLHDVAILVGGPVFLTMAALNYLEDFPSIVKMPIAVTLIGAGVLLLIKQPNHLSASEWIEATFHGVFQPTRINHLSSSAGMEREATDFMEDGNWWETSGRTQDLTGIKRIHETLEDDVGVIERDSGRLVGAIKVEGVNMALATPQMWERKVSQLSSVLNTLEHPIQMYITTAAFDIEEHADKYEDRVDDRDIKARPILGAVLRAYIEQVIPSINQGGLNHREYYILVEVTRNDIYTGEDSSSGGGVGNLPVIGTFLGDSSDEVERREDLMLEELENRLEQVSSSVSSIEGVETRNVTSGELARINHEYWSGTEVDPNVDDQFERILGVVVGEESIAEIREEEEYRTSETKIESTDDEGGEGDDPIVSSSQLGGGE